VLCRSLCLRGLELWGDVDEALENPVLQLTHLQLAAAWGALPRDSRLRTVELTTLTSIQSLRSVEMVGWHDYKDVSPVGLLPQLKELTCANWSLLRDVLGGRRNALQSAELVVLLQLGHFDHERWLRMRRKQALNADEVAEWFAKEACLLPEACRVRDFGGEFAEVQQLHPDKWEQVEASLYRRR